MRIIAAQINPTVGDIGTNTRLALDATRRAREAGADLLLLPELVICGYPPMDLLNHEGFLEACEAAVRTVAEAATGLTVVLGAPLRRPSDGRITNSLLALQNGKIVARYDKRLLPTYDVFDEHRYFAPGDEAVVIDVAGIRVGLTICEDLWHGEDAGLAGRYAHLDDPVDESVRAGAELIISPSASPFGLDKGESGRAQRCSNHGPDSSEIGAPALSPALRRLREIPSGIA